MRTAAALSRPQAFCVSSAIGALTTETLTRIRSDPAVPAEQKLKQTSHSRKETPDRDKWTAEGSSLPSAVQEKASPSESSVRSWERRFLADLDAIRDFLDCISEQRQKKPSVPLQASLRPRGWGGGHSRRRDPCPTAAELPPRPPGKQHRPTPPVRSRGRRKVLAPLGRAGKEARPGRAVTEPAGSMRDSRCPPPPAVVSLPEPPVEIKPHKINTREQPRLTGCSLLPSPGSPAAARRKNFPPVAPRGGAAPRVRPPPQRPPPLPAPGGGRWAPRTKPLFTARAASPSRRAEPRSPQAAAASPSGRRRRRCEGRSSAAARPGTLSGSTRIGRGA